MSTRWVAVCACALTLVATPVTELPANDAPTEAPALAPEEPVDYWNGPINGPVPETITGGTVISTMELKALLDESALVRRMVNVGSPVLVEVSNTPRRTENLAPGAPWLPTPHAVIPGSLWIPGPGMGEIPPDVDAFFRDQLASATGNDFDRPIVIYCHERCWLSWNAAKRAIRFGYRRVYWYPDGIEGWRAAGLTTSVAEPAAPSATSP